MINIRGYRLGDEKTISDIHYSLNEFFEEDYVSPQFIADSAKRNDFLFNVAEYEGSLIGFCGALFYPAVGRAQVGPIAVSKEHRKKGVGSKLLKKTLGDLKDIDVSRVIARVKGKNKNAVSFFEKQGFQYEATLKKYTRGGEDATQLVVFL